MAVIELHIYDTDNKLLKSDYNINNYDLTDNDTLFKIDIHSQVKQLGYDSGQYNYSIRIYESLIGSIDGHKLKVKQISQDRTELILNPVKSSDTTYESFYNDIKTLTGNGLNFQNDKLFTYVTSKIVETDTELQLIVKLLIPLDKSINPKDELFIVNQVGERIYDSIVFIKQNKSYEVNVLATPNFSIKVNDTRSGKGLGYNNWDSMITNHDLSNEILQQYFNTSLDSITLNIDYSDFENFIHFSSAENRLYNFKYKLKQLEQYNLSIDNLYNNTSVTIQSTVSFQNNILKFQTLINEVIQSFDGYEKFMYETDWPHDLNGDICSITSSESITYYNEQLDIAKDFDIRNIHSLVSNVPPYFTENNEQLVKFINLLGQNFDIIWLYIKDLENLRDRTESIDEGLCKYLLKNVLQSVGWEIDGDFQLSELVTSGSNYTINATTDIIDQQTATYEIWNRILNNIPILLKTKGTYESVRTLSNIYGIPNQELMIKEYEGDKLEPIQNHFSYNKFIYGLEFNSDQYVEVPYYGLGTLEFRFKTTDKSNQTIFERSDTNCSINLVYTNEDSGYINLTFGSDSFNSNEFDLYDFDWYTLMFTNNENQYNLYVKKQRYNKIISCGSGSFTASDVEINNDTLNYYIGKDFIGYIQEFRYWNVSLQERIFNDHVLSPTSYMSNSKLAYYDDLIFRLPFGTDTNTYNHSVTTQTNSQHPQANTDIITVDYINFENKNNYELFTGQFKTLIPDIGGQQITTEKIKIIDNSITNDRLLDIRNSVLPPKLKRQLNCFYSGSHKYYGNEVWENYLPCTASGSTLVTGSFASGSTVPVYENVSITLPSCTITFEDVFTGSTIQLDLNGSTYIFEASNSLNTGLYFKLETLLSDSLFNLKTAIERYTDGNYEVTVVGFDLTIKGLVNGIADLNPVITASTVADAAASGNDSGGVGVSIQDYSNTITGTNTTFFVDCDAYSVPDKFEILVGGNAAGPTYVKASSHISDPTVLNGSNPDFDPASDYSIVANPSDPWYIGESNGTAPTGISEFEADTGLTLPMTSGYQQRIWVTGLNAGDQVYLRVRGTYGTAWVASARVALSASSVINVKQEVLTKESTSRFTLFEYQDYPTLTIPDSPKLEIAYCPTDEIDFDIFESMGEFNIDNIIGSNNYVNNYPRLKQLKELYYRHHESGFKANEYNKLFKFVNNSFFNYIRKSVPSRASLFSGLVIEPHVLDRRKVCLQYSKPKTKDLTEQTIISNPVDFTKSFKSTIDNQRKYIIGYEGRLSKTTEKSTIYLIEENITTIYIYLIEENQPIFNVYQNSENVLNLI